jgi:hypothetical protein
METGFSYNESSLSTSRNYANIIITDATLDISSPKKSKEKRGVEVLF